MNKDLRFQSAASGLWYTQLGAAGDVSAVEIDGVRFIPEPPPPFRLYSGGAGTLSHLEDFGRFAEHIGLLPEIRTFVGELYALAAEEFNTFRTAEGHPDAGKPSWFLYWPKDYIASSDPVLRSMLEFHWEGTGRFYPYTDGQWMASERVIFERAGLPLDRYDKSRAECLARAERALAWLNAVNERLEAKKKPPAVTRAIFFFNESHELCLQIGFSELLFHEPWEEGSPGYDT